MTHQEDRPEPGEPGPEAGRVERPWETVAGQIADEVLAIHEESYGGGAADVRVHLVDDDLIIVVLDDLELLPSEELLLEKGHAESVLTIRSEYQRVIEPTFRAAVERASGRTVTAFSSHTALDGPRFSVELFRLLPRDVQ
jgi:uncharacterized protein YbcI